jgi:hypothetical protein
LVSFFYGFPAYPLPACCEGGEFVDMGAISSIFTYNTKLTTSMMETMMKESFRLSGMHTSEPSSNLA